jgi:transcription initiation factor TFIIIB Brf1 subunit/transcription initiation factor TFIIB
MRISKIIVEKSKDDESEKPIPGKCPECKSTDIVMDYIRSEKICSNCGFVLEERMINSALSVKYYNKIPKQ